MPLRSVAPTLRARPPFTRVVGAVWMPGLGLALSSVGFGAMTAFITLLFASRGWSPTWPGLTLFSLGFILVRSFLDHLPEKVGGARVALVSVVIEAAGLALIWLAPSLAVAGAMLTGLGYSLVYPASTSKQSAVHRLKGRGLAMGAYTACLDLALGVAGPVLGLVASLADCRSQPRRRDAVRERRAVYNQPVTARGSGSCPIRPLGAAARRGMRCA